MDLNPELLSAIDRLCVGLVVQCMFQCRVHNLNITVPYITPQQRSHIQTIINKMVRHTQRSSRERQALRARIRVVSSSPLNVRRTFERLANKHEKQTQRPDCLYTTHTLTRWQQCGTVANVDGHYALLPVRIEHQGARLRATDPLPCLGSRSRTQAVNSLAQLARTLHIQHTYTPTSIAKLLPPENWDRQPLLRHRVQNLARSLSSMACVRVADKGSTMLFAFCRQWVWDETAALFVVRTV